MLVKVADNDKGDKGALSDLSRDVSVKLTVIARQLRSHFDQKVAKLGMTRSQWALIAVVSHQQGLTQRTIAETLEVSEAAAGRLIDKLCVEGFLERRSRADDRRAYSVHLKPEASPRLAKLRDIAIQTEHEAFGDMTLEQIEQLHSLLDIVYRNVAGCKQQPDACR
jgi:MarR family transcriptional regulator for hemolysin